MATNKERIWPFNGYAPGNYTNTCTVCKETMTGVDKLCFVCLPCAIKGANELFDYAELGELEFPDYKQMGGGKPWDDMNEAEQANYNLNKALNAVLIARNTVKRLRNQLTDPSPSTPLSVEEAAKKYLQEHKHAFGKRLGMKDQSIMLAAFYAGAALQPPPLAADIVQALTDANPYQSGDDTEGAYYAGWENCTFKLEKILSSQPSQEQKQNAADIWQLIPDNIKQSYSGPEEFLADMQAMHHFKSIKDEVYKKLTGQGSVQGLIDALKAISTSRENANIIASEALQSFYSGNQTEKEEEKKLVIINSNMPTEKQQEEMDNFAISFAVWCIGAEGQMYRATGMSAGNLLATYKDRPYINTTDTSQQ